MHFPRLKLFHKPTCWRLWEVFLQRSWQVCLKEGQGNSCWLIRLCTSHSAHSFCLSALGWQLVIWDNFSLALKSCSCFFFFWMQRDEIIHLRLVVCFYFQQNFSYGCQKLNTKTMSQNNSKYTYYKQSKNIV